MSASNLTGERLLTSVASHAEERLHFIEQLSRGRAPYKVVTLLSLEGRLDEEALERALSELVVQHEVLRTGFTSVPAGLVRQVYAEVFAQLHRLDLRELQKTDGCSAVDRRLRALADEPFDLARPSLMRAVLAQVADSQWRLLIVCHHIISDGRSQLVLVRELAARYVSLVQRGESVPLASAGAVAIRQFAEGDREYADTMAGRAEARYWKERLTGLSKEFPFPYDGDVQAKRNFRGETAFFELSQHELAPLFRLAGGQQFVAILAVWGVLLGRYAGQSDVVVGAPFSRRIHENEQTAIGFFANTLPMHIDLRGNPNFPMVLERVRHSVVGGLENQRLDFNHIIESVSTQSEGAEHRNRDAWLRSIVVAREPVTSDFGPELVARTVPFALSGARVDLQLTLESKDGGLFFELEYDTDLLNAATISRMIGHFKQLCGQLPKHADLPIPTLPILTETERAQLDNDWNATRRDYSERTVTAEIDRQARQTPHAIALEFGDEKLTYEELMCRANRLAHHLRRAGVGRQDLVGVFMHRSVEMVVSLLAIHKAQAAYVPLDPDYPPERVDYMIEDAGMVMILTQAQLANALNTRTMLVDVTSVLAHADLPVTPLDLPIEEDSLAYMIYTSGSTGRPKGVLLEHGPLANRLAWMQEAFPLDSTDRVIQKTPFSFDVSVWEFFWPLMYGAGIVMAEPGVHRDPAALANTIRKHNVTVAHFVPSMLELFLDSAVGPLPRLRFVFSSGEALSATTVGTFYEQFTAQLHNLYGPTEAAIDVSHWHCTQDDVHGAVPIGKPISNVRLYVLDEAGNPQPAGLPGELHIGGMCLARGYHRRPELTAERFVNDPFNGEKHARLYKTGDLARFRADGAIEYLGRIDDQIKLRGLRIELGEIEACLREAAECGEAAVRPFIAPSGATLLVGYYRSGAECDATELTSRLARKLPEYMVPSAFMRVDHMPLTPNGKLNRKALPNPPIREHADADADGLEPPKGLHEQCIARCWQDILNVRDVSRNSSFFSLGGDSILGIRLIAMMRDAGYEITIADLFSHHRLADLAAVARRTNEQHEAARTAPADNCDLDSWPASQLQIGMIYHSRLNPEIPVYHDIFRYRVEVPRVDKAALASAWRMLAEHHPTLRARFDTETWDEPRMVIESAPALPVEVVECPPGQDLIGQWVEHEKRTPIDPARSPAYRLRFFITGPNQVVVGFAFHHAILDGWSVASVLEEWVNCYGDILASRDIVRSTTDATQMAQKRYAELERHAMADAEQAEFWRGLLGPAEMFELPRLADESGKPGTSMEVAVMGRPLDPRLVDALRQRARDWAVPLKSVFLAAHIRLLGFVGNRRDVVTGLVTNGRPETDGAERALGMFLNTLPFRVELNVNDSWKELAEKCFALEQRLQQHRWYPLAAIQRVAGSAAISDVIFNFTNFHVHNRDAAVNEPRIESVDYFEQTNVPLVVYVGWNAFSEGWEYRMGYTPNQFSAEQISRYLDYYGRALAALAVHGDGKWIDDMLLSAKERDAALAGPAQETVPGLGGHDNIRDRFEAMVVAHGDRIAVSCGEREWTYRELDRRANALAAHIAQCSVRPGDRVAIALERDLEMVLSIVAVIKAGAAYVPIDPANPAQRIATIVADSGARLLIGTESVLSDLPERPCIAGTQAALEAIAAAGADARPATELGAQSSAYVIFTSGSTGRPKGVLVNHSNVLRLFGATDQWFHFNEHDRWTLFHSFAFDFSVWEMWGALLHGGELVVVPYWASRSAEDFVDLVLTKKVTVLNQTPSAFRNNQRELIRRCGPNPADLPLRYVIFGGEALDFAPLADWIGQFGDEKPRLVNMYGITETTVHVTYRPVRREDVQSSRSLIGTPIPDLALYVLDQHLQPLPVGTVGELVVAGAGVAGGYVNAPDQSRERFVERDLTGSGRHARLYKSGDMARRLSGGDIEYVGRADAQVKIHGYRIETGDIEAALVNHPAVASALVIAFKRSNGDMALASYYVVKQERSVAVQALRDHLQALLPSYMVPSFFLQMESWPLTINGKTDLKALPNPESGAGGSPRSHAAPRTAAEAEMVRTWQQVLGTQEIGIDDTYYALGGDSIQGIRLVGALRRHGFDVALADLFKLQTIRKLFDHNVALGSGAARQADGSLQAMERFGLLSTADRQRIPAGVVDAYPATQLQLGMVFHTKLDPAQATFHDLISYRIELPFNQLALAGLLEQMVRQHDVLRTSFALTGYSRPLQLVHENATLALAVHDMAHLNEAYQEVLIDQWFEAEKASAFQWNAAPLMRFFVHRLSEERFNFSVSFHHAIIDGWSFSRLMAGLLDNYRRATLRLPPVPAEQSTLAYRDYVRLELDAQHDEQSRSYWMRRLQGAPYTKLPRVPEKDPYHRWSEASLCVDEGVHARLSRSATRRNVTLRQLCLAAHLRVLALITQQKDVTTGVFAHGRPEHVDADRMIGLFLNILPVRVPVSADWNELIADVQHFDHEQLPHRRYSYASIQRDQGGRRLVETGFNFVEFGSYRDRLGSAGAAVISDIRWFEHADFALLTTFEVDPFTGQLRLSFNAAAQVLSQDALETIADIYRNVLRDLANTDQQGDAVESHSAVRPLEVLLAELPRIEDRMPDNYDRDGAVPCRLPRTRAPVNLTAVWHVFVEIYRERAGESPDGSAVLDFQPDSLEALRIVSALRAQCGVNIPLRVLLGDDPVRATLRLLDQLPAAAARG
ncbi:MAG: hypothetical protein QOC89_164 [Paraburkholderia sp.]|nr:hypothetical protein [Paraburkholderia sp.]